MKLDYFDLTGKVAVVSGGATGIGYGISEGLAEAGVTLVICSRRLNVCEDSAHAIHEKTGAKVLSMRCDITSKDDINALIKDVVSKLGGIDILVNCAGVGGSEKAVVDMDESDWDSVMNINLKGAYTFSQAVIGPMRKRGKGGRIINVSSILSIIASANMSAYCVAKSGLTQLTKVMALELVRDNILVNAILPGYVETPMNTEFFSSKAGEMVIKKNIPMRRIGQIQEMKGLAILLASEASSLMTGSALVVDGGNSL